MAVEDKYVDALVAAGKKTAAGFSGADVRTLVGTFEVAAADDNGSVYRIGSIGANYVPLMGQIWSDAITSGTDFDLGVYKPGVGGAVVDKDIFADGLDLSSALAITALGNAFTNVGGADPRGSVRKPVWELLGLTVPTLRAYDLAITANTVGSAAGTISYMLLFADLGK